MRLLRGLFLAAAAAVILLPGLQAQIPYVKQVLTANSGKFEFSPPYTDYVTLQSYRPDNGSVSTFGSIYTQSAQSVVTTGRRAFFAAQDSIAKYDLNTMARIAAVPDSGLNKMCLWNGKLLISRQYPVNQHFFEVRDTSDLSLVAEVTGISGDCGGVVATDDTVYVAVNGGWMGTQGKIAVIDPSNWTLKAEVPLGPDAIGIFDMYLWNGVIYSVNKTPYGMPDAGSVTVFNPADRSFNNVMIPFKVGGSSGIANGLLYLGLQNGIGSFDLVNWNIADTVIVPDPGSSVFTYILSSAVDSIHGRLYVNIGDYTTPGTCLVTNLQGDSLTSYPTGISSDAIALDYRVSGLGIAGQQGEGVMARIVPNPVTDRINMIFDRPVRIYSAMIIDILGRVITEQRQPDYPQNSISLRPGGLAPGTYYLKLFTAEGILEKPFVCGTR